MGKEGKAGGLGTRWPVVALPRLPSAGCCHGGCLLPLPARVAEEGASGCVFVFKLPESWERAHLLRRQQVWGNSPRCLLLRSSFSARDLSHTWAGQPIHGFWGSPAPCIPSPLPSTVCPLSINTRVAYLVAKPDGGSWERKQYLRWCLLLLQI